MTPVMQSKLHRPDGIHNGNCYRAGELAHDPHYSGTGLTSVEWCWHLEPVPTA